MKFKIGCLALACAVKRNARLQAEVERLKAEPAVKVKPLEWRMVEIGCDTGYNWYDLVADIPFGLLRIRDHTPFLGNDLFSYGYGDYHCHDETPYTTKQDEAKTAAQADYEARILAALEGGCPYGRKLELRLR